MCSVFWVLWRRHSCLRAARSAALQPSIPMPGTLLHSMQMRHIGTVKPQLANQRVMSARVGLRSFQGDGGV